MKSNNAYPLTYRSDIPAEFAGLTKRELFAAMAMQGLLSNPDELISQWDEETVAVSAKRHADALLAALEPQA